MEKSSLHDKARDRLAQEVLIQDLDCVDNWRVARKDNPEEVRAYETARDDGCCGFYDTEVLVDGVIFMIGCNYGH